MNMCCPDFTNNGFTHRGSGKYTCFSCKRDVSLQVLKLFLKDPWGTINLKRKGGMAEYIEGGA